MSEGRAEGRPVFMLLPSLRISGGVKEALRLARDLHDCGHSIELVVLWKSEYELSSPGIPVHYLSRFAARRSFAGFQFPLVLLSFWLLLIRHPRVRTGKRASLILTHFSTFPLAWIAPQCTWFCFNQDVEWMFVKPGLRRVLLRRFILATSRHSRVVTTNAFVESLYRKEGITSIGKLSIWAAKTWFTEEQQGSREIDVVMLLRRGHMKRLDLYHHLLNLMSREGLTSCVVTPDEDIFNEVGHLGTKRVLRPDDENLKDIYRRSKVFLLLSDTEGFALPPLEAMGSGCVPVCRDSGGPRCYMTGALAPNLIPLERSNEDILAILKGLLSRPEKLQPLSEFARKSFSDGYASSILQRQQCLTTVIDELRT